MEQPLFHVLLDGRRIGPYDRRTIIGMRLKETLTLDHVLVGTDGVQLTVAQLIARSRSPAFDPGRTSSQSLVQATYTGSLVAVAGRGTEIPRFRGEAEIRVQTDVLRIAGRRRHGFGWKEDRVKLPLQDLAHARVQGSRVELRLRSAPGREARQLTLELFSAAAAAELVGWLPAAPWPAEGAGRAAPAGQHLLWVAAGSATVAIGIVVAVVLTRRLY